MNRITTKILPLATGVLLAGSCLNAQFTQDGVTGYPDSADIDNAVGSSNLSGFVTTVTNAFNNETGATQAFELSPGSLFTQINTGFGVDRSLRVDSDTGLQTVSASGSFDPLQTLAITSSSNQSSLEFTFAGITENGTPLTGEGVTHIGFTILPRDNTDYPLDIEAVVTFDNASTSSLSATIPNISNPADPEYTFYEFEAAPGRTIDTLTLSALDSTTGNPVSTRIGIDNLGFVTSIPEPGSFALLGGIGILFAAIGLRWRRR